MPAENIFSSISSNVHYYFKPITTNEKIAYPLLFAVNVVGNIAFGSSSIQFTALNVIKDVAFSALQLLIITVAYRIFFPVKKEAEQPLQPQPVEVKSAQPLEEFPKIKLEKPKDPQRPWDYVCLGNWYRDYKRNLEKAYEHYQIAADLGIRFAQIIMGNRYAEGIDCKKDYDEAFKYYKLATEIRPVQQFLGKAFVKLGLLYMSDKKIKRIDDEIRHSKVGNTLSEIKGWRQNKALALFESATKLSSFYRPAEAWYWIGFIKESQNKFDQAILAYQKALEDGFDKAGYDFKRLLVEHYKVDKKYTTSTSTDTPANMISTNPWIAYAEARALHLGKYASTHLKDNLTVITVQDRQDKEKAIPLYKIAMEKIPDAAYQLGLLFMNKACYGDVSIADAGDFIDEAINYYKIAMDQGHIEAKRAYLQNRIEFDNDYREEVEQAGFQVDAWSLEALGVHYESNKQYNAAFDYYEQAAKQGCKTAEVSLGRLYCSGEKIQQIDSEIAQLDSTIKEDPGALLKWRQDKALERYHLGIEAGLGQARYFAAEIYESQEKYEQALETYKGLWEEADRDTKITSLQVDGLSRAAILSEKLGKTDVEHLFNALQYSEDALLGSRNLCDIKKQKQAILEHERIKYAVKEQRPDLFGENPPQILEAASVEVSESIGTSA